MSKPNPLREKPTPKRRQIDFFFGGSETSIGESTFVGVKAAPR